MTADPTNAGVTAAPASVGATVTASETPAEKYCDTVQNKTADRADYDLCVDGWADVGSPSPGPSLQDACAARFKHAIGSGKVGIFDQQNYQDCIDTNGSNLNK